MMISTAATNVEANSDEAFKQFEKDSPELEKMELSTAVDDIASNIDFEQKNIELVFAIHGYNTAVIGVKKWFRDIAAFANKDPIVNHRKNQIFVGYRWPSESFANDPETTVRKRFVQLFTSLPLVPLWIVIGSLVTYMTFTSLLIWLNGLSRLYVGLVAFGITISLFLFSIIFSLVILRLTLYFRDSYRANHYAVPDLIEIIRQLDKTFMIKSPGKTWGEKQAFWKDRKVKISFIGHSMGGFVVTNVVRILSDVFDPRSIGNLTMDKSEKEPDNNIGNTFRLGRLILVSPDIPVDSILEGRSNFLSSSLRRFEEAYLFSNEGDLALRLASTAANYFSYPAKTRTRGYRLGNVAITAKQFGIHNLEYLKKTFLKDKAKLRLKAVTIGYGKKGTKPILDTDSTVKSELHKRSIAELFTFFDCTDYIDTTTYPKKGDQQIGVVSYSAQKDFLGLVQYLRLAVGYFFLGKDVHGGYFRGDYATEVMYRIAFVGFKEYLKSITPNNIKLIKGLDIFSKTLTEKKIQVVLAPERYAQLMRKDIDRSEMV
jgi:hypothetical protein